MKCKASLSAAILFLMLTSTSAFAGKQWIKKITQPHYPVLTTATAADTIVEVEKNYEKAARQFKSRFSGAVNPLWTKEGETLFVSFTQDGRKHHAVFSTGGKLKYALACLNVTALPDEAKEIIGYDYSAYRITSVKEVTTALATGYEVLLENNQEYRLVYFTESELFDIKKTLKPVPAGKAAGSHCN
jgi:hypothetical protein